MQIHQLVHTLSYGDAISGEVLALQRCFRAMGFESEIFAINVHPKYEGMAHDYRQFDPKFLGEVVLHYSLGSPLNELYLALSRATRTLIYHNLTPAHWFKGVNPRIVSDIEDGLRELPQLCRGTSRLLADSAFNAGELKALGFDAAVLPLPLDAAKWSIDANPGIYSLVKSEPGIHLVHVGRLAPNKCIEDIIKVFYFLHHHINRQSRLWLVGIDIDTELYSFALKRMVNEFKLDQAVSFVGCLADSEVKALYQAASVYICMSEHEGFCLPVLEAMQFGLPVIAYESSALPETVGSGGILFSEKRIAEIAELIDRIYLDKELRRRLVDAGHARAAEFSYEKFEERVRTAFSTKISSHAVGDSA